MALRNHFLSPDQMLRQSKKERDYNDMAPLVNKAVLMAGYGVMMSGLKHQHPEQVKLDFIAEGAVRILQETKARILKTLEGVLPEDKRQVAESDLAELQLDISKITQKAEDFSQVRLGGKSLVIPKNDFIYEQSAVIEHTGEAFIVAEAQGALKKMAGYRQVAQLIQHMEEAIARASEAAASADKNAERFKEEVRKLRARGISEGHIRDGKTLTDYSKREQDALTKAEEKSAMVYANRKGIEDLIRNIGNHEAFIQADPRLRNLIFNQRNLKIEAILAEMSQQFAKEVRAIKKPIEFIGYDFIQYQYASIMNLRQLVYRILEFFCKDFSPNRPKRLAHAGGIPYRSPTTYADLKECKKEVKRYERNTAVNQFLAELRQSPELQQQIRECSGIELAEFADLLFREEVSQALELLDSKVITDEQAFYRALAITSSTSKAAHMALESNPVDLITAPDLVAEQQTTGLLKY